jgi:hypothetical protein
MSADRLPLTREEQERLYTYINNSNIRRHQGLQSVQYWQQAGLLCIVKHFTNIKFEIVSIAAFELNFIWHYFG